MRKKWKKKILAFVLALSVGFSGAGIWNEQTLADTNAVETQQENGTISGVLICANCNTASPSRHPVSCTLMKSCEASGYGILVPTEGKKYLFYGFDADGNAKAKELLLQLKEQGVKNNLTVTVKGKIEDKNAVIPDGSSVSTAAITQITEITYDETHETFQKNAKSLKDTSVQVASLESQTYTGNPVKPTLTITDGTDVLKVNYDYQVEYEANTEVGTAKIHVTGIGTYTGTVTKQFRILPRPIQWKSSSKKGILTLRWSKRAAAEVSGYEIQYATKKSFAKAKTIRIKKPDQLTLKIKGKTKKTYYLRIRAYKKVGTQKYVSAWKTGKSIVK